jgi:chitin synthase
VYLIVCSFALTGQAFKVSLHDLREALLFTDHKLQNIPNQLKNKTQAQVILTFFTPPVGALIAAAVSTFGIYFIASFLYVCIFFQSQLTQLSDPSL